MTGFGLWGVGNTTPMAAAPVPTATPATNDLWAPRGAPTVASSQEEGGPLNTVPSKASVPTPAVAPDPTWVWGLEDRTPQHVFAAWLAYAATQGYSHAAMTELLDYAHTHPSRYYPSDDRSTDEWVIAVVQSDAPEQVLKQFMNSGYMLPAIQASASGTGETADSAEEDVRELARCHASFCAALNQLAADQPEDWRAGLQAATQASVDCGTDLSLALLQQVAAQYHAFAQTRAVPFNGDDTARRQRYNADFKAFFAQQPAVTCEAL